MTIDEALEYAARQLDEHIADDLRTFEATLRREIAATGPEDQEALDRPPDPDSPWRRSTVEEAVMWRQEQLARWREEALANIRRKLTDGPSRG